MDSKSASIQRILKMLFGSVTEKTSKVLKEKQTKKAGKEKNIKGHGKNGASAYSGANKIKIPHESLKPKDRCPVCKRAKYTIRPVLL